MPAIWDHRLLGKGERVGGNRPTKNNFRQKSMNSEHVMRRASDSVIDMTREKEKTGLLETFFGTADDQSDTLPGSF